MIIEEEIVIIMEIVEMGIEFQNFDDVEEGEIVLEVVEDVIKFVEVVLFDVNVYDSKDCGLELIVKLEVEDFKILIIFIIVDVESVF